MKNISKLQVKNGESMSDEIRDMFSGIGGIELGLAAIWFSF